MQLKDPSLLKTGLFINGEWRDGSGTLAVTNPATGTTLADIANAGAAETTQAIDAAADAMGLALLDPSHRARPHTASFGRAGGA